MLTAEELIALKSKVEAEMKRRCYYGSLAAFADVKFEHAPIRGQPVYAEQGKKVIEPLLQIQDRGDLNIDGLKEGERIPSFFDANLSDYVDELAKETVNGSSSSCRGACTGLCVGTCGNGCSGCTAVCGGTCESACTKTCGTACGSCTSSCNVACQSTCTGGCNTTCTGCKSVCGASCNTSCSAACGGCTGCNGGATYG